MDVRKGASNFYWLSEGARRMLATKSLAPGRRVYGERLVQVGGSEYRTWDPNRSKLAAAIMKGLKEVPIREGSNVLYLGAASGTTSSHVSDIVGKSGAVYCIEFAPRSLRDLIGVCEARPNMLPLLADARQPQTYADKIEKIDVIYQDVAQPDQARILIDNAKLFLKKGQFALIAVKSQSIDVTKKTSEIYENVLAELSSHFEVVEKLPLEPYEKDHLFVSLRVK
ncbi:Fibrillarin-like rRNA/tRNA 2'-O-methyltransferase [Candidatus Burarchaeum australiense]|nr:Fibrillarin-like rRNA/tRNA 2'-O-methyltransferase [Candidatus Burarchaeum australiense]